MFVEVRGDAATGSRGLADVNASATVPEDIDVGGGSKLVVKPAVECPSFCVDAATLAALDVPATTKGHSVLEFVACKVVSQGLGCELLKACNRAPDLTTA